MAEEFSTNTIAAEALASLIKSSFEGLGQGLTSKLRNVWSKVFEDFSSYTGQVYRKNRNVRILCVKDRDVDLYEIYVQSKFSCGREVCSDDELIFKIREGQNVVINGNGGAGKTFFMRHLWLKLFENPGAITPVFIELRNLNELSTYDLKSFIRLTIADRGLSEELFDHFCTQGSFCFILDGFDEVLESAREALQSQILKLASKFDQCAFVLSSRPDKRFSGWSDFEVFGSMPFEFSQVTELVDKVPFDERYKKIFKKKLDIKFFAENASFLSNPLLAIMMMMTFRENMEIPKSMSIFYDQAFNTLFVWHDATKGYARKKVMDIVQFKKSFGVFCLLSYNDQLYEFSAHDINSYIDKSNRVLGVDFKADEILKDYVESVNLMQQDGLSYVFIHRSFQEYFAAFALTTVFRDKCAAFSRILKGRASDGFLKMAYEIDSDFVLREFIFPEYAQSLKDVVFRRSVRKKFQSLVTMGITYVIKIVADHDVVDEANVIRLRLHSLGLETQSNLVQFLELLSRLQDVFSKERQHPAFESGFVALIFGEFQKVLRKQYFSADGLHILDEEKAAITLAFSNSTFSISLTGIRADQSNLDELKEAIEGVLRDKISVLFDMAEKLGAQILDAQKWCDLRIQESRDREKSLDEVLGLI